MTKRSVSDSLDGGIFGAIAVVLIALIALLALNLAFQYLNYRDGIGFALADKQFIDHAIILTYSRAWDFAVIKTSALFLSFLMIFTGALYVLRSAETRFEASAEKGDLKGSLSISSPGLVMVALGVFLVAFVLSNKTMLEYSRQGLTQRAQPETKEGNDLEVPLSTPIESIEKSKEQK